LEIDYSAVRTWLGICESNHSECHGLIGNSHQGTGLYPSVLIDVSRKCLVTAQVTARYYALSYLYGGIKTFKTTAKHFQMLQKSGSFEEGWVDLPAVIRDAITLTERIGEQFFFFFFWKDSLCIIHDEDEEFRDQIGHMDIIYGQAVLTFGVLSSDNANNPIPGVLPYSRSPLPRTKLWHSEIFFCPVDWRLELQFSIYETRAWTLQERLLSPRTLFITKAECLSTAKNSFIKN
jgi:hypothetical protein